MFETLLFVCAGVLLTVTLCLVVALGAVALVRDVINEWSRKPKC